MNAIIVSTLLGVIMMFCSWGIKSQRVQKNIALIGLIILIIANLAQSNGWYVFNYDTKGMLTYTTFGLYANTLLFALTLIYVWINGDEIAKINNSSADF